MKDKKVRRIIVLVLCLLLIIVAILLLSLICQHPWLLFFFGPPSLYVLYRGYIGSAEERRQARERNAAIKGEHRRWQNHRFFPISKRGRAAYLILCFEEALKFYYGENLDCWKWLLEELWQITSTWDIDGWVGRVGDASPETVLEYRSYQEIEDRMKRISLQSGVGFWYSLTEEEFIPLQKLYMQEKDAPFFPVINELYDTVFDVITLDWGELETDHTPSALSAIDKAEQILTEHSIPLPQNQQALNFITKHRDGHYGKPFDGISLSSIL